MDYLYVLSGKGYGSYGEGSYGIARLETGSLVRRSHAAGDINEDCVVEIFFKDMEGSLYAIGMGAPLNDSDDDEYPDFGLGMDSCPLIINPYPERATNQLLCP